ncbi:hypothetical protein CRUP_037970 [Coryphaenoides rupestris]|nr:hypothetical protein CRUP_037970 [Coryphaenoides rupestris]
MVRVLFRTWGGISALHRPFNPASARRHGPPDRNEFFFDRHAQAFLFIMLYVRSGTLRFVPGVCELSFYTEMLYWGLESAHLDTCCQRRLDDRMSEIGMDDDDATDSLSESDVRLSYGGGECQSQSQTESRTVVLLSGRAKWMERTRQAFEEPNSSFPAQILATVSVVFVITSMVMLCLSTLPDWDTAKRNMVEEHSWFDRRKSAALSWWPGDKVRSGLLARPSQIIDVVAISPSLRHMCCRRGAPGAGSWPAGGHGACAMLQDDARLFMADRSWRSHIPGPADAGGRRCAALPREMVMLGASCFVAMAIYSCRPSCWEHGRPGRAQPAT